MPRKYNRKLPEKDYSRVGHPPIDDTSVARGVLLEVEGFGRDKRGAIQGGASALMEQRARTSKPIKLRRDASQRVREEVDKLIAASAPNRATYSILDQDAIGRHLRQTQSRDEFVKIIALCAVERSLARWDDGRLGKMIARDPDLPHRMLDCALKYAREQVPREFVPIP